MKTPYHTSRSKLAIKKTFVPKSLMLSAVALDATLFVLLPITDIPGHFGALMNLRILMHGRRAGIEQRVNSLTA